MNNTIVREIRGEKKSKIVL